MRAARILLAACLLLAPARAEDAAQLLRRLDTSSPAARESAAHALAALGPEAFDELFALLSPAAQGARDETLARAFAFAPPQELRAWFCGFTRATLPAERVRPALLVLREAGSARELARCLEVAGPGGGELQAELVEALAGILAREPAASEQALALGRTAPVPEAEALARALATAHRACAARALVRLATQRPELGSMAYSALLSEADALPRPLEPELLGVLREELARDEHPAAQELLLLAGRLEDDEAVPLLIERLGGAHPELQSNALWSLRRITGLGLGPDAQAWAQWFRDEAQWWKERAPEVFAELRSGGSSAAGERRALGELGQRFWRRAQLAAELSEYLGRAKADGGRMACGLLARLRCPAALPALQARSEDEDPAVRESARRALAELAGKKVPPRRVGLGSPR